MAYVNADGPAQPVQAALDSVEIEQPTVVIRYVPVLVFHRDNRMYEWTERLRLPLGPGQ